MNLRALYSEYIYEQNVKGSRKAPSYVQALDYLDIILKRSSSPHRNNNFWSIASIRQIINLYDYARTNQKDENSEFFQKGIKPSYGSGGFYSAALKSYKEFLIIHQHKERLWKIINESKMTPTDLSKHLQRQNLKLAKVLVGETYDYSTREGKDKLREVKTRINQDLFRDMILYTYQSQCCLTGLNIPGVLRASHILPWAKNVANRLNAENGLCLSATYDAAFDRYLISFDENYRMIFSPRLKEYYSNKAFQTQFKTFEGQKLILPKINIPNQKFLEKHRNITCKA